MDELSEARQAMHRINVLLSKQNIEIERLRGALETIAIVEAGSAAAASMRLIAVRALSDKKEANHG